MSTELLESIQSAPGYLLAGLADSEFEGPRRKDVLFYSGAKVERFDFWTGEFYDLSFSMDGGNLAELSMRGRVLNGHSSGQALDVIGAVENPRRESRGYVATLRFTDADDVEPIWQRIEDGTLRDVSMGVRIEKLDLVEDDKRSKRKHYMAAAWTPYEISVVPIGADPGARFLAADPRLDRLRTKFSATPGAASKADESEQNARLALQIKQRRFRVLGR